jgi:hypothetical protein
MARNGPVPVLQCILADSPTITTPERRGSFADGAVTGSALLVPR